MNEAIINFIINDLHGGNGDIQIQPEDDLLGSGLVESMGMMLLVQFIEDTYELKVAPQDMTIENFMTVDAMVNYINSVKE